LSDSANYESIDIFCHCLPPAFVDAVRDMAESVPLMFERAVAIPAMSNLDARFRVMNAFPGYRQVLSLASPTVEAMVSPAASPELAKRGNDALAEWARKHSDRFPGFVASLPMNNPVAAMRETERAVRELGACGVQIYSNVDGHPLDEPQYLQIIEHAASIGGRIWLHPIRPMTQPDYRSEAVSKFDLWWAFGWPYETSVAMARLVFAGIFDRWPDLVVITHHGGGIVPMMEGRLDSGMEMLGTRTPPQHLGAVKTVLKEKCIDAFHRFYADTATFGSKAALQCAHTFFGDSRVLFGTDMPFDPDQGPRYIRQTLQAISELPISDEAKKRILNKNAIDLLGFA
jgi:predicted TIM-barrel fold metal-dependent hydrolase